MHWYRVVARPLAGLACGLCLANVVPARAGDAVDDAAAETPAGYMDVIVTAAREAVPLAESPGATTVVTDDVLRASPKTLSVGEALALVPGLKIDTQYASEKSHLSIRGQGILTETGIRGIEILLDGIPLNGPGGFAPDLYDVDWATVDHVEVIRGPSGALYGGGSSAGVINIVTKSGRTLGGDGEAGGFIGANSYFKSLGQVGGNNAAGTFDYRFSASSASGDGSRVHSAFDGTNVYGKTTFKVSPSFTLSAILMGTNYRNENPEGLNKEQFEQDPHQPNPDSITYDEFQHTKRVTLGLVGHLALAKQDDLDATAYARRTDYNESFPAAVLYRRLDNPGALVKYTHHFGSGSVKNHVSLGADYNGQTIDEYRRLHVPGSVNEYPEHVSDDSVDQSMVGAYVMDRIELGRNWDVTLSLRHDRVELSLHDNLATEGSDLSGSRDFSESTGRVGVTWNPKPGFGVYATWGEGFMPPSVEEMLANPDHFGGFNATIVPATSTGEELGVRGVAGAFNYDVAAFYLTTANDFGRYRRPDRPLETFYYNEGDSRRYGLETALNYLSGPLAARLAYTYNHFTYTRIDSRMFPTAEPGNLLPNSPEHKAYVDVEYGDSAGWYAGLSVDAQSKSYVDATNVPVADGYTLLHLRAGYRWSIGRTRAELSFALRNVTDKTYVAYSEPDPDGNSYQAGPGREWFASARFLFGAH